MTSHLLDFETEIRQIKPVAARKEAAFDQSMGAFIVNFQIRCHSLPAVRSAMEKLVTTAAYVSPSKNGWITVYDAASDEQDDALICRIAAGISRAAKTDVFGFIVHDSDFAGYWLYRCGSVVDQFNSAPDLFEEVSEETREACRGKTDVLWPLCVPGTTRAQIDAVIHPEDDFPVFAEKILTDLAPLLGIDNRRISLGFEYFERHGRRILADASEFARVGQDAT